MLRSREQHYGLTLNDTLFSNETTIREHIDAGVSFSDEENFLVEKYGLVSIDRKVGSWEEQSTYLHVVDILRARRYTGLLKNKVK